MFMTIRFTDDYLLSLMAQASAALSAEFHGWLEKEGVAVSTWRILASLYPDEALSIGELCASCLVKQPTMTRMIDRLSAQDLVRRDAAEEDRRRVTIRLTATGGALADRLVGEARAHEARILSDYSREDADALKALLKMIRRRATGATRSAA